MAERSLLEGLRPLIVASRFDDPPEKISFADQHWVRVPGGHGSIEVTADVELSRAGLRNAGRGMAVLHGWIGVRVGARRRGQRPTTLPSTIFVG